MPHVTFPLSDLRALAREPGLTIEQLDAMCLLVKGELKADKQTGKVDEAAVKVELQDTNRPDTWCVEGIARQGRQRKQGRADVPACFQPAALAARPALAIEVDRSVEAVRPFVAGFVARGYTVDDAGLQAFIAAQEVLSRNYGRNRKAIAIGIYDASRMSFPVRYEAVPLDGKGFVPLSPAGDLAQVKDGAGQPIDAGRWSKPWTPRQILKDHPTGREYAAALQGSEVAPLLSDAKGEVLSFPPIINSAGLGRVTPGMSHLFVEVTGTTQDQVLLAANILAVNLADRGATIEAVETRYPYDTPRGRAVRAPHGLDDRRSVDVRLADLQRILGEPVSQAEADRWLFAFGVGVERVHDAPGVEVLRASTPPWRLDYLHAVDAVEDFAIARGYDALTPIMPAEFTVGGLSPVTRFQDLVRERLIGLGFEEGIGNILTSIDDVRTKMNLEPTPEVGPPLHGGPLVRIKNVMNENYSMLRDWLLPTLLEVEHRSNISPYPHRIFEAGEAGVWDADANLASRTEQRAAALVVHEQASFSEAQALVHALLRSFGLALEGETAVGRRSPIRYELVKVDHPSFIAGRAAWIVTKAGGKDVVLGLLGELHPEVLTRWKVYFPAAGFELRLDPLRPLAGAR